MRRQQIEELRFRARTMSDDLVDLFDTGGRKDVAVAARVALRRMVGRWPEDPAARAAHAYLARYVREDDGAAVERAFYAVAAMIAAQPRYAREITKQETDEQASADASPPSDKEDGATEPPSGTTEAKRPEDGRHPVGASLGVTLGAATAKDLFTFDTVESRLHLLCRQGLSGVHRQLPPLVARLRAVLAPVDWPELTVDLARWGADRDHVTKRWLQDFYRTHNKNVAMAAERKAATDENPDTPDDGGEKR